MTRWGIFGFQVQLHLFQLSSSLALAVFRMKGSVAVRSLLYLHYWFLYLPINAGADGIRIDGLWFFYGLWPIAWIIIGAVFLYKISVKTGQFDIIRSSILSITEDQRLQMLLWVLLSVLP
jgi:L-lactate permease